jgi:5-formyltetrahydrofolate cyclo-ligase
MNNEVDIRPLMLALLEKGHTLCLPEAKKEGGELIFHKWQPGAELVPGPYGTQHPTGEILVPNFVLVPLLAFDARGYRLGYGSGFYDRTLAQLPHAFRLGCAYAIQEIEEVPVGPNDTKLHAIVTEHGLIGTGSSNWIK